MVSCFLLFLTPTSQATLISVSKRYGKELGSRDQTSGHCKTPPSRQEESPLSLRNITKCKRAGKLLKQPCNSSGETTSASDSKERLRCENPH